MNNRNNLVLVLGKHWCGLFFNGVIIDEYGIIPEERIREFGDSWDILYCNESWLANQGYYPSKLSSVVLAGERW